MKQLTLALLLVAGLASCDKEEAPASNNNPDNNSNLSSQGKLLVAGKWLMSANTATGVYMGKDTTVDYYIDMDACDKDDFILYASDGTGTIDESANKCADDNQVENFKWVLLNNDTRLALIDSNPDTFDVVELTATQLKFKITANNSSGVPITEAFTYKNIK